MNFIGMMLISNAALEFIVLICLIFSSEKAIERKVKIAGVIMALTFSMIAFMTYPNEGTDLRRYYEILDQMELYSTGELFSEWIYASTPVTVILFLIVKFLNIYNMLPFIAALITILCYTLIITNFVKIYSPSYATISIFILVVVAIYGLRALLTGVRQALAVAILCTAIYRIYVEKRFDWKSCLALTLSPLIHVGVIPVALLIIAIRIIKKRWVLAVALYGIGLQLIAYVRISNPYIRYIQNKFLEYNEIEYPDIRFFIVRIAIFVILGILSVANEKAINKLGLAAYNRFILSSCLIAVISFTNQMLFDRIITIIAASILPTLFCVMEKTSIRMKKFNSAVVCLLLFCICGVFAYQIVDLRASWRLWTVILQGN